MLSAILVLPADGMPSSYAGPPGQGRPAHQPGNLWRAAAELLCVLPSGGARPERRSACCTAYSRLLCCSTGCLPTAAAALAADSRIRGPDCAPPRLPRSSLLACWQAPDCRCLAAAAPCAAADASLGVLTQHLRSSPLPHKVGAGISRAVTSARPYPFACPFCSA